MTETENNTEAPLPAFVTDPALPMSRWQVAITIALISAFMVLLLSTVDIYSSLAIVRGWFATIGGEFAWLGTKILELF